MRPLLQNNQSKMDWRCGSSKFKTPCQQKKKKKKTPVRYIVLDIDDFVTNHPKQ
jgi:hypothetical protein